jgi:hypothetical protein
MEAMMQNPTTAVSCRLHLRVVDLDQFLPIAVDASSSAGQCSNDCSDQKVFRDCRRRSPEYKGALTSRNVLARILADGLPMMTRP